MVDLVTRLKTKTSNPKDRKAVVFIILFLIGKDEGYVNW